MEVVVQTYRRRRHRVETLVQIEREILNLRIRGLSLEDDTRLWKTEAGNFQSCFSTKQTWEIIRSHSPRVTWSKGVWFRGMIPKYSFITWLATQDRLATGDRILKWNPQADTLCLLCKSSMESRDHLFFTCPYSQTIWSGLVGRLLASRFSNNWNQILSIVAEGTRDATTTFLIRYSFQTAVYSVWQERNGRRVGEREWSAALLLSRIDKQVRNRISSINRA